MKKFIFLSVLAFVVLGFSHVSKAEACTAAYSAYGYGCDLIGYSNGGSYGYNQYPSLSYQYNSYPGPRDPMDDYYYNYVQYPNLVYVYYGANQAAQTSRYARPLAQQYAYQNPYMTSTRGVSSYGPSYYPYGGYDQYGYGYGSGFQQTGQYSYGGYGYGNGSYGSGGFIMNSSGN
ncbi:MAG TPA: hypothetical protein VGE62_02870 [Candidatus Paceibacterota bacterium]